MARMRLHCLLIVLALLPGLAGADALNGEQLFTACAGCHAVTEGIPHGVGPNLHGLRGRKAGTVEGFAFSPALQASEITWEEGTLTAWILATEGMVPGTWMLYHNHLEAGEVARLVDYLLQPE